MIWFLRILFAAILASMLWVTTWAGLQVSLFAIPHSVSAHPWFIATLFDAYWGFVTFYIWVAYKEAAWLSRLLWFATILLLGNIAMSLYCLIQLWRVPSNANVNDVLLRSPRTVSCWVPLSLLVVSTAIAWRVQ